MKTVEQVWSLIDDITPPLATISLPPSASLSLTLRETLYATTDFPPFHRSAVDGYILCDNETATELVITGEIPTGHPPSAPERGTALRVLTGSALPEGDFVVIMQEDAEVRASNRLHIRGEASARHIRRRGSHARAGDAVLTASTTITPASIALAATLGATSLLVSPPPTVAHLVTGDELLSSGNTPALGFIHDSNSPLIHALLTQFSAKRTWHQAAPENYAAQYDACSAALETNPDIILISGGAGYGDHDYTSRLLRDLGFEIIVQGVLSRPGRPLLLAHRDNTLAFGLPGNPLSHYTCFHLFVRRALARLTASTPAALTPVSVTGGALPEGSWRLATIIEQDARWMAAPLPFTDSSDIFQVNRLTSLHGLVRNSGNNHHEMLLCIP